MTATHPEGNLRTAGRRPRNQPGQGLERNARAIAHRRVRQSILVTREEFDVQAKVLARTWGAACRARVAREGARGGASPRKPAESISGLSPPASTRPMSLAVVHSRALAALQAPAVEVEVTSGRPAVVHDRRSA